MQTKDRAHKAARQQLVELTTTHTAATEEAARVRREQSSHVHGVQDKSKEDRARMQQRVRELERALEKSQ